MIAEYVSRHPRVTAIQYTDRNHDEVREFLGVNWTKCPDCDGYGEIEGEYGPKPCNPCNSRCISYSTTPGGKRRLADWDDYLVRHSDGSVTHLSAEEFEERYLIMTVVQVDPVRTADED